MKNLWTAPAPTQTFVGREDLMESAHKKLQRCGSQHHHMSRMVALVAPEGMGKTETARAFAQKYEAEYENVAWVDAGTEISLRASFLRMAKILKIPYLDRDTGKDLAELVYAHVSEHIEKPALFIFDNAGGLKSKQNVLFTFDNACGLQSKQEFLGIQDYLPNRVKKNIPLILLTSENADWRKHCEIIHVTRFSMEESLLFFQSVFKLSDEEMRCTEGLVNLFGSLARKLNGHPLALSEAAAQISVDLANESLLQLRKKINDYIKSGRGKQFQKRSARAHEGTAPAGVTAAQSWAGLSAGYLPGVWMRMTKKNNRNEIVFSPQRENASLLAELGEKVSPISYTLISLFS